MRMNILVSRSGKSMLAEISHYLGLLQEYMSNVLILEAYRGETISFYLRNHHII